MSKSETSLESEKLKNVDYDLITRGVSNLHIQFLSTTVTNCFRATLQEKKHCIIVLLMNRVTCETRIVCRLPPRNKYCTEKKIVTRKTPLFYLEVFLKQLERIVTLHSPD